jgi:hypothetical protein
MKWSIVGITDARNRWSLSKKNPAERRRTASPIQDFAVFVSLLIRIEEATF